LDLGSRLLGPWSCHWPGSHLGCPGHGTMEASRLSASQSHLVGVSPAAPGSEDVPLVDMTASSAAAQNVGYATNGTSGRRHSKDRMSAPGEPVKAVLSAITPGRPGSAGRAGESGLGDLARPASPGDLGPRPGSSGGKHSMTRLPDEPPGFDMLERRGSTGSGSGSPPTTGRPGSARLGQLSGGGMMRLPSDEPTTPVSHRMSGSSGSGSAGGPRPTSGGPNSRKASLSRLPDEVILAPSADKSLGARPPSAENRSSVNGSQRGGAGGLRDRLNKNLTVTTTLKGGQASSSKAPRIFRLLKDGETINDYFDFGEEIYSGGSKGKVVTAVQRSDGSEVVIKKRMKNPSKSGERTWRAIMSQVHSMRGSRHVLDIIDIYEDETAFYVVMPKCNGGELFEFLATETEVPEAECKRIIREILTAVGHLHENNLVHRDIKPENIMFDVDRGLQTSPKTVKLIDFDTCLGWAVGTPKSRRFVGTPGYIAPEALLGEICPQSDLWSIGVILYILMTGEMPWSSLVSLEDGVVGSPGATRMYNALKAEVLDWEREPWPEFPLARDLCQKLMEFDVDERLGEAKQALQHPWLTEAS